MLIKRSQREAVYGWQLLKHIPIALQNMYGHRYIIFKDERAMSMMTQLYPSGYHNGKPSLKLLSVKRLRK